jgi:lipopolysaccharide/colanic/teichoic acid biosynthesis glycosyltransferase
MTSAHGCNLMLKQTIDRRRAAAAGQAVFAAQSVARWIVFRQGERSAAGTEPDLLEYALSTAPLSLIVLDALHRPAYCADKVPAQRITWAIPREWQVAFPAGLGQRIDCTDALGIDSEMLREIDRHAWLVISNGRFVVRMNRQRLEQGLASEDADVVAVLADPELAAYRERVRLTQQGQLAGFRRLYHDSMEPIPVPADWPHQLYVRREAAGAILSGGLPGEFQAVVEKVRSCGFRLRSIAVAGSFVDLGTEDGLLSLGSMALSSTSCCPVHQQMAPEPGVTSSTSDGVSPRARLLGPVLFGDHVCVEPDAVIIGPSILCDHSTVRAGAVVDASIIGTRGEVSRDQIVRHSMVITPGSTTAPRSAGNRTHSWPKFACSQDAAAFRHWSRFSYAVCLKRVVDTVAAVLVLALFAPIIPFIALAIKINSPGPVFFRDRRQGLHGRPFKCVKFRTMRVGADKLQDKLRFISEVDGPQFKMADDPRITTVGRFLRETYLDEIPQFYNVLMGDMSVVGPRPSPEAENTLCPWWRDARLSVRPGVTGLWQVCRTREPMKDFQEWIHYDTRYVREFSWRLDLWICWQTFKRMVANFLNQF